MSSVMLEDRFAAYLCVGTKVWFVECHAGGHICCIFYLWALRFGLFRVVLEDRIAAYLRVGPKVWFVECHAGGQICCIFTCGD